MLSVEKEMIGLLFNGASNPVENLQVSFFLVSWSVLMLGILRMVGHENKKQAAEEGENPESRRPNFERLAESEEAKAAQIDPDDDSRLTQLTKRRN